MTKTLTKATEYQVATQDPQEVLDLISEELAGETLDEFSLDRVKVPAGGGIAWEVPTLEGPDAQKAITGIVIHSKITRAYWAGEFAGEGGPPDCSSIDAQTGAPGEEWTPPDAWSGDCTSCPLAQYGTNGRGQACKMMRQVFLLKADGFLPLVVTLPPTSLKAARAYFLGLANAGVRKDQVETTIGLEKQKSGDGIEHSRATFKLAGRLPEETAAKVSAYAGALRPHLSRVDVDNAAH